MNFNVEPSSFRDNDATIIYFNNKVYRLIYQKYKSNFDYFINSGLYSKLLSEKKIINHKEVNFDHLTDEQINNNSIYKVIVVEKIPFISYPYELSFEQLKEAALLTLKIQIDAINLNMSLKDASSYNVQFIENNPIFIDTSSFEIYQDGSPWGAYRQFCMHFLSPLLMHFYRIPNSIKLLQLDINGISLEFASKVLPLKSYFNLSTLIHIHLHAISENKNKSITKEKLKRIYISRKKLLSIIEHLYNFIEDLKVSKNSDWTNYYESFSYTDDDFNIKKSTVDAWLTSINNDTVIDAGCNVGEFSYIASKHAEKVIAFDFDESVISKLFLKIKKDNIKNIYPLVIDIFSPSPSIGWMNKERTSFIERLGKNNTTLALALIHHLTIGNNVPFKKQAELFSLFSEDLIVEYVPKDDVQVSKLLTTRKDIYHDYSLEYFLLAFSEYFIQVDKIELPNSKRVLIHLKRKN
jgi:ribosomal protein L11 methylase PrmA